jgi:phosphinothricin acetyltransferase
MASEQLIRRALPADLEAISAIYDHEVLHGTSTFDTEPRTPEAARAWFDSHQSDLHPLIVSVDGSEVTAWGSLTAWSPRGAYRRTVEASVFVHPNHRGRGIGADLLLGIVDLARAAEHRVILGRIEAGNAASRRMLLRLGFSSIGVMHRVGEKFGRVLDVELFEMVL